MTIEITIDRNVIPGLWHICGNMGCQNYVLGIITVCLRCWIKHLLNHNDKPHKELHYNIESL